MHKKLLIVITLFIYSTAYTISPNENKLLIARGMVKIVSTYTGIALSSLYTGRYIYTEWSLKRVKKEPGKAIAYGLLAAYAVFIGYYAANSLIGHAEDQMLRGLRGLDNPNNTHF